MVIKTIKLHFRIITLFFSILIFFQGCTVYKSANVTLEQAVIADTKVKIKTNDNRTLKFKRIAFEDGSYYGINETYKDDPFEQKNKALIKTHIDVEYIENMRIKNKTMSIILPLAIPIVLLGSLLFIGGVSGSF